MHFSDSRTRTPESNRPPLPPQNGYTPLHQAAQQGHTHIINLLLHHGAPANELTNVSPPPPPLSQSGIPTNRLGFPCFPEWEQRSVHRQEARLHLRGRHPQGGFRGNSDHSGMSVGWGGGGWRRSHANVHVCAPQTVMEKHKMNVPETMNEVLDMSDDEGQAPFYSFWVGSGGGPAPPGWGAAPPGWGAAPPGWGFCRGSEVPEPQTWLHFLSLVVSPQIFTWFLLESNSPPVSWDFPARFPSF